MSPNPKIDYFQEADPVNPTLELMEDLQPQRLELPADSWPIYSQSLVSNGKFWLGKVGELLGEREVFKEDVLRIVMFFGTHLSAAMRTQTHITKRLRLKGIDVLICVAMLCGQMCWYFVQWNDRLWLKVQGRGRERTFKSSSSSHCKPFVSKFFFLRNIVSSSMVSTRNFVWEVFPSTLWDGRQRLWRLPNLWRHPPGWPCLSASRSSKWCLEWWNGKNAWKFHGFQVCLVLLGMMVTLRYTVVPGS